jgi:hypothetical protein
MIPKEILIKTIQQLDYAEKQLSIDLDTEENQTLEKFQELISMHKAWHKLSRVIEFEIKPLIK